MNEVDKMFNRATAIMEDFLLFSSIITFGVYRLFYRKPFLLYYSQASFTAILVLFIVILYRYIKVMMIVKTRRAIADVGSILVMTIGLLSILVVIVLDGQWEYQISVMFMFLMFIGLMVVAESD